MPPAPAPTAVLSDEFNRRSQWNDARERYADLEFIVTDEYALGRAYQVPSLRNVAERAGCMDAGAVRDARRRARSLHAGDGSAARSAAASTLGRSRRVLVVLCSADGRAARRLRQLSDQRFTPWKFDISKWLALYYGPFVRWLAALDDFRNWLIREAA